MPLVGLPTERTWGPRAAAHCVRYSQHAFGTCPAALPGICNLMLPWTVNSTHVHHVGEHAGATMPETRCKTLCGRAQARTPLHRVCGFAVPVRCSMRPPALRQACAHALPDIVVQSWTMFRAYARPPTPKTRCKVVSPSARACRADKCLASGFRGCRRGAHSKRTHRVFIGHLTAGAAVGDPLPAAVLPHGPPAASRPRHG